MDYNNRKKDQDKAKIQECHINHRKDTIIIRKELMLHDEMYFMLDLMRNLKRLKKPRSAATATFKKKLSLNELCMLTYM